MDFFVEFSIFLKRQVIFKNEKILLILSFMFFSANSYAIVSQEIPGETFSYFFDFYTVLGIDNQNAAARYSLLMFASKIFFQNKERPAFQAG